MSVAINSNEDISGLDTEDVVIDPMRMVPFPNIGKNDSLKSTRSLSVFRNTNAPLTMARSEEMTYDMYEVIEMPVNVDDNDDDDVKYKTNTSDGSYRSPGGFKLKTAAASNSIPSITSPSLHDSDFKANLSNSLARKLSIESGSVTRSNAQTNDSSHHSGGTDHIGRSRYIKKAPPSSLSSTLDRSTLDQKSLSRASSSTTLTSADGIGGNISSLDKKLDARKKFNKYVEMTQSEADDMDRDHRNRLSRRNGSDSETEIISHSLPRYSPAEVDVSNSLVRDANFKAKMAALYGVGSGTTSPGFNSCPPSLLRSHEKVQRTDSSGNNLNLTTPTESQNGTLSSATSYAETPSGSRHATLESLKGNRTPDARSQGSTTPSDMRDLIRQGSVSKLAKELAIRGISLTGRSRNASSVSSLERPSSRASNRSFKYAVEGIDTPAAEDERTSNSTTTETEDEIKQSRMNRVNLLADIRNRETKSDIEISDERLSENVGDNRQTYSEKRKLEAEKMLEAKKTSVVVSAAGSPSAAASSVVEKEEKIMEPELDTDSELSEKAVLTKKESASISVEITDGSEISHNVTRDDQSLTRREEVRDLGSRSNEQSTNNNQNIPVHGTRITGSTALEGRRLRKEEISKKNESEDDEEHVLRLDVTKENGGTSNSNEEASNKTSRMSFEDELGSTTTLTDGSEYSGRQRGVISGRQKMNRSEIPNSSSSEKVHILEKIDQPSKMSTELISTNKTDNYAASGGRKIIITGRDNIRRITSMNEGGHEENLSDIQRKDLTDAKNLRGSNYNVDSEEEFSDVPRPAPRSSSTSIVQNNVPQVKLILADSSSSYDRQDSTEREHSLISANVPRLNAESSPARRFQRDSVITPTPSKSGTLGLQVKISNDTSSQLDRDTEQDSNYSGRIGLYEQNRRRSKQQRRSSRTSAHDSSLTDQSEDLDNRGSRRSSAMRRRIRRHISRGSIESEPDDLAIQSEPEFNQREETFVTRVTTPVSGLIIYGRSASKPELRPSTVTGFVSVRPNTSPSFSRPVSVTHRSITPVVGLVNIPTRSSSKPDLSSRSVTPMRGIISVLNSPQSDAIRPQADHTPISVDVFNVNGHDQSLYSSPLSPNGNNSAFRAISVLGPESPEIIAVDPELRDAEKTGNLYHITMSLRPIVGSRPGSRFQTFQLVDTAVQSVPMYPNDYNQMISDEFIENESVAQRSIRLTPVYTTSGFGATQPSVNGRNSRNQIGFHLELQETPLLTTSNSYNLDIGEVLANGNQTTSGKMIYGSPMKRQNSDRLPKIVRGSILIKNAIDTTNPPQVIDIVGADDDDDDDPILLEDNSNMFHGKYQLRKENPLYLSDPDLSKAKEKARNQNLSPELNGNSDVKARESRTDRTDGFSDLKMDTFDGRSENIDDDDDDRDADDDVDDDDDDDDFDREIQVTRDRREKKSKTVTLASGIKQTDNGMFYSESNERRNHTRPTSSLFNGGHSTSLYVSKTMKTNHQEERDEDVVNDPYKNETFDREVKVNNDYWLTQRQHKFKNSGMEMTSSSANQRNMRAADNNDNRSASAITMNGGISMQTITNLDVRNLMVGTSSSVKQTIKVDRLEDEIIGPLSQDQIPQRHQGVGRDSAVPLDFDKVSEQVDMDITEGKVILTSRVRSERTVPIMGSEDIYKKSAVILKKCIEIDMTLTPQRRRLYELITNRQNGEREKGGGKRGSEGEYNTLDKMETFELYKKFAALADLDRAVAA